MTLQYPYGVGSRKPTLDGREHLFDPDYPVTKEDNRQYFWSRWYTMYHFAERKRSLARSYRNFNVACAVLAVNPKKAIAEERYKIFYGVNSKAGPDYRNICAEPVAFDGALMQGYTLAAGFVVVGNTQEDHRGITEKTLCPCKHCLRYLKHSPLVRRETICITALPPLHKNVEPWEITFEKRTCRTLFEKYKGTF